MYSLLSVGIKRQGNRGSCEANVNKQSSSGSAQGQISLSVQQKILPDKFLYLAKCSVEHQPQQCKLEVTCLKW